MELKKSPKADLNNKRGLFLEIGLIISLGFVIIAFAIGQKDKQVEKIETEVIGGGGRGYHKYRSGTKAASASKTDYRGVLGLHQRGEERRQDYYRIQFRRFLGGRGNRSAGSFRGGGGRG